MLENVEKGPLTLALEGTNQPPTNHYFFWLNEKKDFYNSNFFFASTSKTREVGNRIWPRVFTRFSPTKCCIIWPHLEHEILLLRNFVILLAKQRRNFKESICKQILSCTSFTVCQIKLYLKSSQNRLNTVSLSRIWSIKKMNQANGYWSSPDHYWGNQMAPKIEIFNDPFWRKFRFFLAHSIKSS